MNRYRGNFEDLEALIVKAGYAGEWSEIASGKQFRCEDGAILNWFTNGTLQYQGPREQQDRFRDALTEAQTDNSTMPSEVSASRVAQSSESSSSTQVATSDVGVAGTDQAKVFVVHGHDTAAREQLQLVLYELGLNPIVLQNTDAGGQTIIEALENEIGPDPARIRFGIVLMTPDDMGFSRTDGADQAEPRARQNVVLEMGMLISAIKRPNVVILKKGNLAVPSDVQGIIYIEFNDHVRETVPRLVQRLTGAGFELDPEKISRASVG